MAMKPQEIALVVVGILLFVGGVNLLSGVGYESYARGPAAIVPLLGLIVIVAAGYIWPERRQSQ